MADFVYGLKIEADATEVPAAAQQAGAALDQVGAKAKAMADRIIPANDSMVRGWKLNQIGMLELRAAGVNTFQALAAGMDPLQVAMMEGSQVIGAFVQGGVRLSMLLGPLGAAAALVGVVFAGLMTKTDDVAKAQERLNKMYEIGKGAIDKLRLTGKDLNEQLEAEITNRGRLGVALLEEVQKRIEAEKLNVEVEAGMMIGPGANEVVDVNKDPRVVRLRQLEVEIKSRIAVMKAELGDWDSVAARFFRPTKSDEFDQTQFNANRAIAEQVKALQDEASATRLSTRDRAIQVELLKAEHTARMGNTVVTQQQRAAIVQAAGAAFDYNSNQALQNTLMKEAQSVFEATRTPVEKYAREIEDLNGKLAIGKINQDTYTRAVQQSNARLVQADPILSNVAQGIHEIGDSLLDVADRGGSAWDILTAGLKRFEHALFELGVENPLLNALFNVGKPTLSSAFNNLFNSNNSLNSLTPDYGYLQQQYPVGHRGGRGDQLTDMRWVHPAYFDNAPRFHAGRLGDDEMAAVIKKNETIFTPRQLDNAQAIVAALAQRDTPVEVNIIDQRGGNAAPAQVSERRGPGGGRSIDVLIADTVDKNLASGRHDRTLATNFGVGRRPGR